MSCWIPPKGRAKLRRILAASIGREGPALFGGGDMKELLDALEAAEAEIGRRDEHMRSLARHLGVEDATQPAGDLLYTAVMRLVAERDALLAGSGPPAVPLAMDATPMSAPPDGKDGGGEEDAHVPPCADCTRCPACGLEGAGVGVQWVTHSVGAAS